MVYYTLYIDMLNGALYIAFYLFEIGLLLGVTVFLAALIYSSVRGAPYVPTKKKIIEEILKTINLKKGQNFLELGCGDGRVLRMAALHYGVRGLGIDINPIIIWWAKWKSRKHKNLKIRFEVNNVNSVSLAGYDVIYLFLMPELLSKLGPKIRKEADKDVTVVSHGFKVEGWDKYLADTLKLEPFYTYYYRFTAKKKASV